MEDVQMPPPPPPPAGGGKSRDPAGRGLTAEGDITPDGGMMHSEGDIIPAGKVSAFYKI